MRSHKILWCMRSYEISQLSTEISQDICPKIYWDLTRSIEISSDLLRIWDLTTRSSGLTIDFKIRNLTFHIWHFIFVIWLLKFDIGYLTLENWHLKTDIWHLTFDFWHLTFDIWHLTFDIWHLTFDIWKTFVKDLKKIWNLHI